MALQHFDLVIIGGGSAGYAAARTAREAGAEVAIVDHGPLGGLCILRGCMPSKTLLASADAAQRVREASKFGIETQAPQPNMTRVIERKRRLIAEFAGYRSEQIEKFPLFHGQASFESSRLLCLNTNEKLSADRFIIATGSTIAVPPLPGLAELGYLTSDDLLDDEFLPSSMVVLGGGSVASELGQYLHRMGVRTEIIIRAAHLLSSEDADVGEALTQALREEGLTITTGAQLERVERAPNGQKRVIYRQNGVDCTADADEIALFLGRVPNIDGLNLEAAGVKSHAMRGIEVDANLETTQPGIYAVGDVTGIYPLVHVAIAQGEFAAKHALGKAKIPLSYDLLKARTIYTEPQVAVVGETERELTQATTPFLRASYLYADHGKAMTLERTAGFVKILASPEDGRILGAALVGAEASELIHELIVAMYFQASVFDLARIPHLHPTLSEIITYPAEELAERISTAHT